MPKIQVGEVIQRDLDGKFLPKTKRPIFHEIDDNEFCENETTKQDERACDDISKILADKFKQYKDGCRKAGIEL